MALISDQTLDIVFNLQRQLLQIINQAGYIAFQLFERFGETQETIIELKELDNIREKARLGFSRLNNSILLISQYQPIAPNAAIIQLETTISRTIIELPVLQASIKEIQSNWNL